MPPKLKNGRTKAAEDKSLRSPLFVGSVEKTFLILYAFDSGVSSLSLSQIAAKTQLHMSAVQRFVYTLQMLGYLRKDPETRQYSLSPKLLNLGTSYLRTEELARRATPYIRQASHQSGETISLLELDGIDIIHIIRYGALQSVNTHILLGTRKPALFSAGGRIIVAHLGEDTAGELIDQSYESIASELPDRKELNTSLEEARSNGFSVVNAQGITANVTVAAPIFGPSGFAIASVEFAITRENWLDNSMRQDLMRLLFESTQTLSSKF